MSRAAPLGLFQGFGIEIEYMIVERDTFKVLPVADRVLAAIAGRPEMEVAVGPLCWSNELVLHVIELKTNGPVSELGEVHARFQESTARINGILDPLGGRLMPGGMHPTMNPATETRLWPHDEDAVYRTFDRIFGCKGHGWSNLQSVHLNLPFDGDAEFGRLHAGIRLLLPLLPALSAASPFVDGKASGLLDSRLEVYRLNSRKIPRMTAAVVPEAAFTRAEYDRQILQPLYQDLEPHDPEGILRYEWANARGAIARFDRNAIEIRVLDTQEAPVADLAIVSAVTGILRALADERIAPLAAQQAWSAERLAALLPRVIRKADHAVIDDDEYLDLLGIPHRALTAGEIWRDLLERFPPRPEPPAEVLAALQVILEQGPLARRMLRTAGPEPDAAALKDVCRRLADCLAAGEMLEAP